MAIKKRLILISVVTFISSLLFIPFLIANDPTIKADDIYKTAIVFIAVSTIITTLTAWGGLRFSDKLNISMPILRNWETGQPIKPADLKSVLSISILFGTIAASLTLIGNYFMHPPINPGGFLPRILTAPWASVVTESVSHLFILSGLILLIKNKWTGIIISGLIFVMLFHLNSDLDTNTTFYLGIINFLAATLTGYLFVTKGFEYAVLTHMVMHLIVLAVNT